MRRALFSNSYVLLTGFTITLALFSSCIGSIPQKTTVYFNDFEQNNLSGIQLYDRFGPIPARFDTFNNSKVLGRFNNMVVELALTGLPEHTIIRIDYDLFMHDGWEGNNSSVTGAPDAFQIVYDNTNYLITTFSNGPQRQAFPGFYYPTTSYPARGDALDTLLPGACSRKTLPNGSSLYHMTHEFEHSASTFKLHCNDAAQPADDICRKSWSMDNLQITVIKN